MKRTISLWQFSGFAFTSISGTLLHFLYEWTGGSKLAALISGVNESTWEHMKLLYFPLMIYAIIEYYIVGKRYKCYWCIKLSGTILGLVLIPVIFYTLSGVFGKTADWINITIFFVAAALVFIFENKKFKNNKNCTGSARACLTALIVIGILFMLFTFRTPELEIFRDPITNSYGI